MVAERHRPFSVFLVLSPWAIQGWAGWVKASQGRAGQGRAGHLKGLTGCRCLLLLVPLLGIRPVQSPAKPLHIMACLVQVLTALLPLNLQQPKRAIGLLIPSSIGLLVSGTATAQLYNWFAGPWFNWFAGPWHYNSSIVQLVCWSLALQQFTCAYGLLLQQRKCATGFAGP